MSDNIDKQELERLISTHFNLSELRTLMFELGINFEDIEGDSISSKSVELMRYVRRNNKIPSLLEKLKSVRPNVQWPGEADLRNEEIKSINVPYIILAMTRSEVDALIATNNLAIQHIQDTLGSNISLATSYGKNRNDWVPYAFEQDQSISEIVENAANLINESRQNEDVEKVNLVDFSSRFFHEEDDVRIQTWNLLIKLNTCIVFVDSASLFHPILINYLQSSYISTVATMIFLSPIHSNHIQVNRLIEAELESQLWLVSKGFQALNLNYEIGVNNLISLRKWLKIIMPKAIKKVQDSDPNQMSNQILGKLVAREERDINRIFGGVS